MTTTTTAPDRDAWALLFGVRRSVRYHMRRQRFFDRLYEIGAVGSLIAGSSTVVTLLARVDERLVLTAAAATAIAGAIAVVLAPARNARLHNDLARSFIQIEREFAREGNEPTEARLAELMNRRLEIEAEEPPVLRVLDAMCHNELLTAVGADEGQRVRIAWFQRWPANWLDVRPDRLRKRTV